MKLATFGVKWASDDSFCPSTVARKEGVAKLLPFGGNRTVERANSVFGLRLCEILLPLEEISLPATPSDPR